MRAVPYARHPLQVLRILEEGHLAQYQLPECLRRHNCTWDEYRRIQKDMRPKGAPIAFASRELALMFIFGAYEKCKLTVNAKGIEVVSHQTEEKEMPHDTGFRLSEEQVNAIAVEMLDAPHEPSAFFEEYHNLSHSTMERIRNGKHLKLSDENRKNLLKMKAGKWVPPAPIVAAPVPVPDREKTHPNMVTEMQHTSETRLPALSQPKLNMRELLTLLRQRMADEGIVKMTIPDQGDILVTRQEAYKL